MIAVPVAPLRSEKTRAFVRRTSGCELETVDSPVYPEHPKGRELREARVNGPRHVTIGQAARHLKMAPADYSGLEFGRMTFATESEWASALAMVRELAAMPAEAPRGRAPGEGGRR